MQLDTNITPHLLRTKHNFKVYHFYLGHTSVILAEAFGGLHVEMYILTPKGCSKGGR